MGSGGHALALAAGVAAVDGHPRGEDPADALLLARRDVEPQLVLDDAPTKIAGGVVVVSQRRCLGEVLRSQSFRIVAALKLGPLAGAAV